MKVPVIRPVLWWARVPPPQVWCSLRRFRRLVRTVMVYSLLLFLTFLVVLYVGAEVEQLHVDRLSDTLYLYQTPQVCGMTVTDDTLEISTYPHQDTVRQDNGTIAHCGSCGACSTPHDITIYDNTKNTLFGSTVTCAKRALLWGRVTASQCMEESVGFTDDCNTCWVENILCDLKFCVFLCMRHSLFGEIEQEGTDSLNPCTTCDEKRCGPSFVQCAGANRRRTGILSDIERDYEQEVCTSVDAEWWKDPTLPDSWEFVPRPSQYSEGSNEEESAEQRRLRPGS